MSTTTDAPANEATLNAGDHNPFVHGLLTQAQALADEKAEVFGRIKANRDMLRNIKTTGLLSAEQATAVEEFYPLPKKGEKEASTEAPKDPAPKPAPAAAKPAAK